ncbi:MAG TPA: glycosyltransferase family 39 protein [Kofleriaceae bacterium]|nr:glycosyltransferase family 39 protein [Kofleriaceae bacterium]
MPVARTPRALTQEPLAGVPPRGGRARWWGVIPVAVAVVLLVVRAWLHSEPLDRLAPAPAQPADPPGVTARAGSIYVARGGPVIVGFQSDGRARLSFAGHDVQGAGLIKSRVVVPEGPTAIRFAAPAGARLVWSPVGRRGDPEYVPASSLSPDAPDRAVFRAPGTSILDGVIALGLLATLIATLCVLGRRRLAAVSRSTWLAMAIVLVAGIGVRWYDLGGFGQAWDEDVNWAAGRNYVTNLVALDFRERSWQWNFEHPPVMKLLDGIGAQLSDGFGPARALSAIWIALGCALLVPIGARLFRPRIGVLAAAIATLLPPMVAHGQIVGHESPSVLWWSLAIVLALGVHDYLPADDRRASRTLRVRLAWVGVAIGVAIASRFINGFVGILCAVIVVVQAPPRWRRETLIWGALVMPLAALVTFYAVWPRLWLHPVAALLESYDKLDVEHGPEPFLGVITSQPGPHYFVAYLFATLPVGVLAGVLVGVARMIGMASRSALIAAAWLVVPLGVVLSPVRQDGVRYVMPCIAALALIAAVGFDQLAVWARVRHAFTAIAAIVVAYLGGTLVRVHPYYLDYFGEQVGGAATVAARGMFETAWWGEGVDRAVAYVNAHALPGARVDRDCIQPIHLAWFRADLWTPMTSHAREATWLVSYAPSTHRCAVPPDARRVFAVTSGELVLAAVYERPAPAGGRP